jgi:hypothetical protein
MLSLAVDFRKRRCWAWGPEEAATARAELFGRQAVRNICSVVANPLSLPSIQGIVGSRPVFLVVDLGSNRCALSLEDARALRGVLRVSKQVRVDRTMGPELLQESSAPMMRLGAVTSRDVSFVIASRKDPFPSLVGFNVFSPLGFVLFDFNEGFLWHSDRSPAGVRAFESRDVSDGFDRPGYYLNWQGRWRRLPPGETWVPGEAAEVVRVGNVPNFERLTRIHGYERVRIPRLVEADCAVWGLLGWREPERSQVYGPNGTIPLDGGAILEGLPFSLGRRSATLGVGGVFLSLPAPRAARLAREGQVVWKDAPASKDALNLPDGTSVELAPDWALEESGAGIWTLYPPGFHLPAPPRSKNRPEWPGQVLSRGQVVFASPLTQELELAADGAIQLHSAELRFCLIPPEAGPCTIGTPSSSSAKLNFGRTTVFYPPNCTLAFDYGGLIRITPP